MNENTGEDEGFDSSGGAIPFEQRIIEATPVPTIDDGVRDVGLHGYGADDTPVAGAVAPGVYETAPTETIPIVAPRVAPTVPHATISPAAYAPAAPMYRPQEPLRPERNPAWPYFLAVVALLAGGLVGYLIAFAGDDDDDAAPATTAPVTSEVLVTVPDGTGDTDAIIDDLQSQIVALTAAQEDAAGLNDQVTELETGLSDMTAERDALAAQIADAENSGSDQQADLDAANEQIALLEDQLATATTDLETANDSVADAESALATAVSERDAATDALDALNVIPNPNYINGAVTKARSDATANGWTLIEQPTESATAVVGTILDQAPPAGSNMIKGSVLYVSVAEAP